MNLPQIVSRDEWLVARKELLVREKELTRQRDALNADRRRLPMVQIDKTYIFEGEDGPATLLDVFEDRLQLVVYHFMFQPEWDNGCPSCSSFADQIGHLAHLNARSTTFAAVSCAPITKILPFKERMGWTFPWYSSHGSDFNYDFHVTFDESIAPFEYNYRTAEEYARTGFGRTVVDPPAGPVTQPFDLHGLSCFLRGGDAVYHTYSTYARGVDMIGFTPNLLDLTALGRQEEWEEPKGRATGLGAAAGSATLPRRVRRLIPVAPCDAPAAPDSVTTSRVRPAA
jgi:predicted dithiol-disulfide oxidoreductase (DUF899 family)